MSGEGPAFRAGCACGDPTSPAIHRTAGPCLAVDGTGRAMGARMSDGNDLYDRETLLRAGLLPDPDGECLVAFAGEPWDDSDDPALGHMTSAIASLSRELRWQRGETKAARADAETQRRISERRARALAWLDELAHRLDDDQRLLGLSSELADVLRANNATVIDVIDYALRGPF